jgi:hypothetical protein
MKKLVIIALLATLAIPTTASAFRDRWDDYSDEKSAYELERIADELQYQQEYREYQDKVREYEEANPEPLQQFMLKHYYKWPQPPAKP